LKNNNEDKIIARLSTFKRNFFSAPFEMMMKAVKEKKSVPNVSFSPRPGDKTWLAFDSIFFNNLDTQFTVYYGISFT
jgi:hypothetical protein